jgi:hypothetical protein
MLDFSQSYISMDQSIFSDYIKKCKPLIAVLKPVLNQPTPKEV